MKINNFRGNLTDISAKKEALFYPAAAVFLFSKLSKIRSGRIDPDFGFKYNQNN